MQPTVKSTYTARTTANTVWNLKLYNYDDDNIQFGVEGDELIIKIP